jgi:hypothetical protein
MMAGFPKNRKKGNPSLTPLSRIEKNKGKRGQNYLSFNPVIEVQESPA